MAETYDNSTADSKYMAQQETSTSDLFRRAQALRLEAPQASYKEIRDRLVKEFTGRPFPSLKTLTIGDNYSRLADHPPRDPIPGLEGSGGRDHFEFGTN